MVRQRAPRHRHTVSVFAILVFALLLTRAQALATTLEKPIDCQVGVNCFIQNYVDLAPGPEYVDRTCGPLSYNKHKGTDIRVPFEMMQQGVSVMAAAPGVVVGARDEMDDVSVKKIGIPAVKDKECGNGVFIAHPDGMKTLYCHMKRGSIRVKKGQQVKTGDILGQVGLSGQTEFTHLHFEVRDKDGGVVCPFTGKHMESGCGGQPDKPLWSAKALAAMPYVAVGALASGFASSMPDINAVFVRENKDEALNRLSPQILFWAGFWGVRKGDVITIRIHTPTGEVWHQSPIHMPKNQAQVLLTFGKKRTDKPWLPGRYLGEATLVRQGTDGARSLVIPLSRRITIEP